jgi:hypothetical protein
VWVILDTWLLGDGEVPELRIGDLLHHVGLRLLCDDFGSSAQTGCGAWATGSAADGRVTYRLRGPVVAAGRQWAVLDIGDCLVLLEPDAVRETRTATGDFALERFSDDFKTPSVGSIGEAVGRLEVVPDYEWDRFPHLDMRRDWRLAGAFLVTRTALPGNDDFTHTYGDPVRVSRMERLDYTADGDPGNSCLVDLEVVAGA